VLNTNVSWHDHGRILVHSHYFLSLLYFDNNVHREIRNDEVDDTYDVDNQNLKFGAHFVEDSLDFRSGQSVSKSMRTIS
jgi:hypothetical protein